MKLTAALFGLATTLMMSTAQASPTQQVNWVDWSSTTSGDLNEINVSMTGPSWNLVNGDQYYVNYPTTYRRHLTTD